VPPKIKLGEILKYSPKQLNTAIQSKQREMTTLRAQISASERNIETWRIYRRNETYPPEICDDRLEKEQANIDALKSQVKKNSDRIKQFRQYSDIIRANARGPEALQRKLEQLQNRK
jgi:hypothetical protein